MELLLLLLLLVLVLLLMLLLVLLLLVGAAFFQPLSVWSEGKGDVNRAVVVVGISDSEEREDNAGTGVDNLRDAVLSVRWLLLLVVVVLVLLLLLLLMRIVLSLFLAAKR